jgi:hypothetical protein
LEGKDDGEGLERMATSSFLQRELRLTLALCSERERKAALPRQRVEWGGSGVV